MTRDPDPNPDTDPGHFFTDLLNYFNKKIIFKFVDIFSLIFILKLDEPFRSEEIFVMSLFFFKSSDFGLGVKHFFLQFLVDILPLRSGSNLRQISFQGFKSYDQTYIQTNRDYYFLDEKIN